MKIELLTIYYYCYLFVWDQGSCVSEACYTTPVCHLVDDPVVPCLA